MGRAETLKPRRLVRLGRMNAENILWRTHTASYQFSVSRLLLITTAEQGMRGNVNVWPSEQLLFFWCVYAALISQPQPVFK